MSATVFGIELNQQQVMGWLRLGLGISGPLSAPILRWTGVSQGDYLMYLDAALYVGTPAAAFVLSWLSHRQSSQVANVANMPAVAQQAALNKISDADKVQVAAAVTGVTVAVGPTASAGAQSVAADPAVPGVMAKA